MGLPLVVAIAAAAAALVAKVVVLAVVKVVFGVVVVEVALVLLEVVVLLLLLGVGVVLVEVAVVVVVVAVQVAVFFQLFQPAEPVALRDLQRLALALQRAAGVAAAVFERWVEGGPELGGEELEYCGGDGQPPVDS